MPNLTHSALIAPERKTPLNPHLPADTTIIHLPRHACYHLLTVSSVLVIPSRLDAQKLGRAIERVIGYWPLLAGRLEYEPSPNAALSNFAIRLGGTVPLEVDDDPTALGLASSVVQPSLGDYCPSLEMTYPVPGSNTPLTSFRLTQTSGGSVLGMTASHGVVDGRTANLALHHLARLYQDPEADLGAESPSFGPSVGDPSDGSGTGKWDVGWYDPIPIPDMFQDLAMSGMESTSVTVSLFRAEMDRLKENAMGRIAGHDTARLSRQDVVSGWWISLLARSGEPVEKVWYAINYRTLFASHPLFPQTVGTNHLPEIIFFSLPISQPADIAVTAHEIRRGLERLRHDPMGFAGYVHDVGIALEGGQEEGMGFRMVPPPGALVINSNLKYDWTPSFAPGQVTQYHTEHVCRRFLRVFRANSTEATGRWDGTVELASQVSSNRADEFWRLVEQDKHGWTQ